MIACVLLVLAGALNAQTHAAATTAPRPPRKPVKPEEVIPFKSMGRGGLVHAGSYGPFSVRWSAQPQITNARNVWTHPSLPNRVYVFSGNGLLVSEDWGKTLKPVAGWAAAGNIKALEFVPAVPDSFYVLGENRGIWQTADGCKTLTQLASKATGLVNDNPAQIALYGGDPAMQTLTACYGEAACGLSVSYDGGKSWLLIYPEWNIHSITGGGPGTNWLFVVASRKDEPDVRGLYRLRGLGDRPHEVARDTGAAAAAVGSLATQMTCRPIYVMADGKGLQRGLQHFDPQYQSRPVKLLDVPGVPEADRFLSIGTTFGSTGDSEALYLYEPKKLGLVIGVRDRKGRPGDGEEDNEAVPGPERMTFQPHSSGLFTGPFVKEGSTLRANASGGMFYAVINNSLYVGRRVQAGLDVSEVAVRPGVCAFPRGVTSAAFNKLNQAIVDYDRRASVAAGAKELSDLFTAYKQAVPADCLTISARVAGDAPPAVVTVDLSRMGPYPDRSCRTQMYDDGLHDDGAPGDGVYAVRLPLAPDSFRNDYLDWRRPYPGMLPLTVTAASDADSGRTLSASVGVVGVFPRHESRVFIAAEAPRDWGSPPGLDMPPVLDGSSPHPAKLFDRSLVFRVKDKPWQLPMSNGGQADNVLGNFAMSFWIRSDRNSGKDVSVFLRDQMEDALPRDGVRLMLLKDGLVEGGAIDATWRRVTIPMVRLLGGTSPVIPTSILALVLGGDGGEQTFWISDVMLFATPQDHQDALKPKGAAQ